jgi:hypothetical protein
MLEQYDWPTTTPASVAGAIRKSIASCGGRLKMGRGKTGCAGDSYAEVTWLRRAPTLEERDPYYHFLGALAAHAPAPIEHILVL